LTQKSTKEINIPTIIANNKQKERRNRCLNCSKMTKVLDKVYLDKWVASILWQMEKVPWAMFQTKISKILAKSESIQVRSPFKEICKPRHH